MNEAARHVMREFKGHITLAFGESDEYRYASPTNAVSSLTVLLAYTTVVKGWRVSH